MKKNNASIAILLLVCAHLLGATTNTDPTQPPGYEAPISSASNNQPLALTAVFLYPNDRIAIIGGKPVKVGDKIHEYTVTTIQANTVELVGPKATHEVLTLTATVKTQREG